MKEQEAINKLRPEHAVVVKQMIHKEVELTVEQILDNKMKNMEDDLKTVKVSLKMLEEKLLGSEEDKRWNRPSFIDDFYTVKDKVEYTFKRINETNLTEIQGTLDYISKWIDRLKWASGILSIFIIPIAIEYIKQLLGI